MPNAGDGVSPVYSEVGHFETQPGEDLVLGQATGVGIGGYCVVIEVDA